MHKSTVRIAPTAYVGRFNVFGAPAEESVRKGIHEPLRNVFIGAKCILQNFIVIHEGGHIASGVVVEDYCRIGAGTQIGANTRVIYGAYLCDDVKIGRNCRIAGFICDDVIIGRNCTVMGTLVHDYNQPHRGWFDVDELAPVVKHDTIVGISSIIVGNVTIGPFSYVAAGAIVTKNVPSWHIAIGKNDLIHWEDWKGESLKKLFAHWKMCNGRGVR